MISRESGSKQRLSRLLFSYRFRDETDFSSRRVYSAVSISKTKLICVGMLSYSQTESYANGCVFLRIISILSSRIAYSPAFPYVVALERQTTDSFVPTFIEMKTLMLRSLPIAFAAYLLTSMTAFGHPGHGNSNAQAGVIHYIATPEHSIPLAVLIAIVGVLAMGFVVRGKRTSRVR